jgi:hypothetical protein
MHCHQLLHSIYAIFINQQFNNWVLSNGFFKTILLEHRSQISRSLPFKCVQICSCIKCKIFKIRYKIVEALDYIHNLMKKVI